MRYLIKNAKIVSKGSTHHGKRKDILIQNGQIHKIGKNISDPKATEISSKSLSVSVGWLDIGTHLGEPGHEHRETMTSLCSAALAGGFTDIAPFPNAAPTIQTKSQIVSLINDGKENGVDIHPIGALSMDTKGENIAEYQDMNAAGSVAISDGLKSIQKTGLLLRALQYAKGTNTVVIHHPTDHSLDNNSQLHEGLSSMKMGIKGSPDIAEHIIVDRDLHLQEYVEAPLCLHGISTKGTVTKVKKAKDKQQKVFASVSYLNLVSTEEDMLDFDTNLKVSPVLRGKSDKNALLKGVANGVIDYICTNHVPLEEESKALEFAYATNGATGLETLYAALNTKEESLKENTLVQMLTTGPRDVLELPNPIIAEGEKAKLTCWDSTKVWTYTAKNRKSKSANNPFLDQPLTGKVIATFNGKAAYLAE